MAHRAYLSRDLLGEFLSAVLPLASGAREPQGKHGVGMARRARALGALVGQIRMGPLKLRCADFAQPPVQRMLDDKDNVTKLAIG